MFSGISGSVFPCSTRSSDENTAGFLSASSTSARVLSSTAPPMPIAPCSTSAWLAGCGIVVSTLVPSGRKLTKSTFATGASARFGPCIQPPLIPAFTEEALPLSYPAVTTMSTRGRPRNPHIDKVVLRTTPSLLAEVGLRRHHGAGDLAALRHAPARDLPPVAVAPCAARGRRLLRSQGDQRRAIGDLRPTSAGSWLRTSAASRRRRPRRRCPGLLATYQDEVPLPAAHWLHLSVRPQFRAILAAADDDVDPARRRMRCST